MPPLAYLYSNQLESPAYETTVAAHPSNSFQSGEGETSEFGNMQTAKVKAKDAASAAKEKVKEGTAKMQGKTGEATAATHGEKEMAKEAARAKKDQATADKHREKAEHRADTTTGRHGTGVPLTGPHGHGAAGAAVDPAYPAAGNTYPATDKYI